MVLRCIVSSSGRSNGVRGCRQLRPSPGKRDRELAGSAAWNSGTATARSYSALVHCRHANPSICYVNFGAATSPRFRLRTWTLLPLPVETSARPPGVSWPLTRQDYRRSTKPFQPDERLPERFEITIRQRPSGQTCLQWNGVFIGDPLTDNIADSDGYRYHDVFHLDACRHSATGRLHFGQLIKHKRKTCPKVDEAQDGGRAIVVEEGTYSVDILSRNAARFL